MDRRQALDGPLPSRVVARAPPAHPAAPTTVRRARRRVRAARPCRPPWRSPACCATCARDRGFGPRVVPIIPDEARTFGMDSLFREFKIYAVAGPEVRAGRPRPAAVLRRVARRPDPRGGHHRGRRRWPASTAAGTAYATPRRADGAVLHLLFDVRLPAGRRPHLGRGRRPGQGLPARRHRRAHHAARRGPPAPGRPQPACWPRPCPSCQAYDPAFAYEMAAIVRARPRTACTAARRRRPARTSSTTSPSTTRTTRCRPGPTGVVDRGHRRGPLPLGRRARRRSSRQATDPVLGHRPGRGPRGRRPSWPSTTASAPSCGAPRPTSALREDALAVERWNRLHPDRAAARRRWSPSKLGRRRRARSSPSPTS